MGGLVASMWALPDLALPALALSVSLFGGSCLPECC